MSEIWKQIPRCEGYEASNMGRVKNNKTMNDYSISSVRSRIRKNIPYEFLEGCVLTPLGIVYVYSQGGNKPCTLLQIVKSGRVVEKTFKKYFSERGLSTVAHRFIKGINHE